MCFDVLARSVNFVRVVAATITEDADSKKKQKRTIEDSGRSIQAKEQVGWKKEREREREGCTEHMMNSSDIVARYKWVSV